MRILIGIPSAGNVEQETMASVFGLDRGGHDVELAVEQGYMVDVERNRLAQRALDGGFDALLFVDSDVVLPPDALTLLAGHGDAPIVSGFYLSKLWHGEGGTQLHLWESSINYTFESCITEAALASWEGDLMRVRGGGAGCLLVTAEALRGIPRPWFRWVTYDSGDTLSEDLWFSEQCLASGVPFYADRRVRCGHVFKTTRWL